MERADAGRIEKWIDDMKQYNATPGNGITRDVFSKEDIAARNYVKEEMKKLGLIVSEDCIGNIFGTLSGRNKALAPIWTGSHIDTVLNGGAFDGMAGVFAGLEALRLIRESGEVIERDISVNVYTGEEMGRFGVCCIGSRALAGRYKREDLKTFSDKDGKTLYDILEMLGYNLLKFDSISQKVGDVYASIELHIEQNNSLEKKQIPIGIVS